jgi:steroid delta-isomerase-like uncharacterized protein
MKMSEAAKTLALRFYERISAGDAPGAAALVAPDYVGHGLGSGGGRDSVRQDIAMWFSAVPDFRVEVQDTIAEGDRVAVRMSLTGTQSGRFARIPGSGKTFRIGSTDVLRVADGAIAEAWTLCDLAGMFVQIGALPSLRPQRHEAETTAS